MAEESPSKRSRSVGNTSASASLPLPAFELLVAPFSSAEFLNTFWEKEPVKITASERTGSILGDSFCLSRLWEVLKQVTIRYELDINVCRCEDGVTQIMRNKSSSDRATFAEVKSLFEEESCTVQFLQPQRYVDILWKTLFELEDEFGSLWGCNAYLTPKGAQGLAPHYDDVEVFVLQLEGCKHWKIYERVEDSANLAMESSGPLPPALVGDVKEEILLQPGDLLYLPRGTVHSATSSESQHSTHITISTYQRQSGYDFISSTANQLFDELAPVKLGLRKGLPLKYYEEMQMERLQEYVASLYREVAEALEEGSVDEAFRRSTKEYAIDFMLNRLPPPARKDPVPETSEYISVINPSYLLHFRDSSEEDDEEGQPDEEVAGDEGNILRIVSCVKNDRLVHMGPVQSENNGCNISVDALPEVVDFFDALLKSYPLPVKVPKDEAVQSFIQLLQDWELVRFAEKGSAS